MQANSRKLVFWFALQCDFLNYLAYILLNYLSEALASQSSALLATAGLSVGQSFDYAAQVYQGNDGDPGVPLILSCKKNIVVAHIGKETTLIGVRVSDFI